MTDRVLDALGKLERAHAALEALHGERHGAAVFVEAREAVQAGKEAVAALVIVRERLRRREGALRRLAPFLPAGAARLLGNLLSDALELRA